MTKTPSRSHALLKSSVIRAVTGLVSACRVIFTLSLHQFPTVCSCPGIVGEQVSGINLAFCMAELIGWLSPDQDLGHTKNQFFSRRDLEPVRF